MNAPDNLILVTGATGAQGGATARALLKNGHRIRFMTRNPQSAAAQALVQAGAEAAAGQWEDAAAVDAAMRDVAAVFSVQIPDTTGTDSERRQGFTLIEAARKAGVRQFVHTSVAAAGTHETFPRWESGYWYQKYWTDKWDIEEAVRHAGFRNWTILKPAFLMDNFAMPKARYMFPHLKDGKIITAFLPETKLHITSADDVGAFALAAFENPDAWHARNIDLATEALTISEIAAILSKVTGKSVTAQAVTPDEAVASGLNPGWVRSQEWTNEKGYGTDCAAAARHGIPLTSLEEWTRRHHDEIVIGG